MPRDTRTRFQGVYARHRLRCASEHGSECDCAPGYWGKVYDRATGTEPKTQSCATISAARAARSALAAQIETRGAVLRRVRVNQAIDAFLDAAEAGTALNKRGRPYKPSAARNLRSSLHVHVSPVLGARRLD